MTKKPASSQQTNPRKKPTPDAARASAPVETPADDRDQRGKFAKGNRVGFQPGQSGNPKGRPKVRTLSEAYRLHLAQVSPDDPEGRTFAELIAESQCKSAMSGKMGATLAAKELADRTEGRARQTIEVQDPYFKQKHEQYERMIEAVAARAREQFGTELTQDEIVRRIAHQRADILTYFPISDTAH